MKASELRIGNWVLYSEDGSIFRIEEIHKVGLNVRNIVEEIWMEHEYFEGIPLTEKWLEKFGFEKGDNKHCNSRFMYFSFPNSKRLLTVCIATNLICLHDIYNGIDDQKIIQIPIETNYVHQLQNLYFALTGEELEINLNNIS